MGILDDARKGLTDLKSQAESAATELGSEEVKRNVKELKAGALQVGRQLKGTGKAIINQVRADASAGSDSSAEEVSPSAAPSVLQVDQNTAPLPDSNEGQSTAPPRTEGAPPGAPPLKPVTKPGASPDGPKQPSKEVIIRGIVAAVVVLVALCVACARLNSHAPASSPDSTPRDFRFELDGKENFLFSRYDVDVFVDDQSLGKLGHGEFAPYEISLSGGSHTLRLVKTDDTGVDGEYTVNVDDSGMVPLFQVACFDNRVEITELSVTGANELRAERFLNIANQPNQKATDVIGQLKDAGYDKDGFSLICREDDREVGQDTIEGYTVLDAQTSAEDQTITLNLKSAEASLAEDLLEIANQPGESADVVISQLEQRGYKDAGYVLKCFEDGVALEDFNRADYAVVDGAVDATSKVITLNLRSTKPIEVSFDEETARRVAVVAMTNCYATDVFTADGSDYDQAKFHSYADMSGYYMTVLSGGTWTPKSANAWHVDDLALKASGSEFYVVVSGDVTFDGTNYVLSSVTATYAGSLAAAQGGDDPSASTESYDPSDTRPFLTVSPELVSEPRDSAAETSNTQAEDAAKAEEREYNSWVGDQFSWWDGSCSGLVDLVKDQLNDEGSFRHEKTGYLVIRDEETLNKVNGAFSTDGSPVAAMNDVYVTMEFTARNGFNAVIKHQAHGIIRYPSGSVELLTIV